MKNSLLRSIFVYSSMTGISRVTGLVRELVFAYFLGVSAGLDIFYIAFRIPNFFRRIFAEGAFTQAFVPVVAEYRERRSRAELQFFLNNMAGVLSLVLLLFTLGALCSAPWLAYIFAPGYGQEPAKLTLTITMLQITFPYILFISLTAYVSGILNSYGNFGVPAFTPNLLNLTLIGATVIGALYFPEPTKILAWGVLAGGVLQLLFQLPFLYKLKLWPRLHIKWSDPGVKRVIKLMVPAIMGVSVAQVSFLLDIVLASFLRSGSIAWLNYADRLTSFPLGVFGIAIVTVLLPTLARSYAAQSQTQFSATLDWALKTILVIAIPATIGLVMLAGPIIVTLFYHGEFTVLDVAMVQRALWCFAAGIPTFMLVKVLASGFYSRQNIKTPVRIAVISLLANIGLALLLIGPLHHAGLALATSLTSILNASLLFVTIKRTKHYQPGQGWRKFGIRLGCANGVLALLLVVAPPDLAVWLHWETHVRILWLVGLSISAVAIYLGSLWLAGIRWQEFMAPER